MTEIVDLNAERNKRDQPDAEFVHKDEFGRPMFTFLLNYEMDGNEWGLHLVAYDEADAEKRVAAIRETLSYRGKLYGVIPT